MGLTRSKDGLLKDVTTNQIMKTTLLLFFCCSISLLSAQNFMIKDVTIFDGERVINNTSVLVENGQITKVNANIDATVAVIDGSGKFLIPALSNSHVHAFMQFNLTEAAKAGVLNLMDMHGMETFQAAMAKISRDSTNMARYYYAGYAATAPDGHGTQFGFPVPTLTDPSEAIKFVEDRVKAGASYIKIIEEPWKPTVSHEIVKSLVDAAHNAKTIAVVHISKVDDAIKVLSNKADALVHIWWDKKISEKALAELVENETFFVIPTILTSQLALENIRKSAPEGSFMNNEDISAEVKRLHDAGVPTLAGTDPPNANINYGTDLYKEMDLMSKAGIPNIDVLKGATSYPAKYFRLENTGFIKEGYTADMILLNADPIQDIQNINNIQTIWKNGKTVKR